jgi:uncharacterized protein (TIGR03437 family)
MEAAAAPVLQFSTHFGGGWNTDARVAVDGQSNAWFALTTERTDLPVSPDAAQGPIPSDPKCRNEFSLRCIEIYIAKVNPAGAILRSTYLGGFEGAAVAAISIDASGSVWVEGVTSSTDFPQLKPIAGAAGTSGVFLARLTPDLSRVVTATLIPLSPFFYSPSMAIDRSGFIYLAGDTTSSSIPIKNAYQSSFGGGSDGFLMKLDPTGSELIYSTYFGGSDFDSILGVAVDADGSAVVVGRSNAASVGFAAKFSPDGRSLAWSNYFTGGQANPLSSVALDGAGDVYASGFGGLVRLARDTGAVVFSRRTPGVNGFTSLAFDPQGNLWGFGETLAQPGVPAVSANAFQDLAAGGGDTILAEWSADGESLWSTFLGGSFRDQARSIAIDPAGAILVAGLTESVDFPRAHPNLASQIGSARPDGFLARFGFSLPAPTLPEGSVANAASFDAIGPASGAAPGTILALFGEDLATRILPARTLPLPDSIEGTSVLVNGTPALLFFVSPEQVNFQLPYGISGSAAIRVMRGDGSSVERQIAVAPASPGVFAVVRLANGQAVGSSNPVSAGDIIVIFATGLGEVAPAVQTPSVTLNGEALEVLFAGLAPGFAGLNQINARVPDDFQAPPRTISVPLVVTELGVSSKAVLVPVK